jgi:hypothetical protein
MNYDIDSASIVLYSTAGRLFLFKMTSSRLHPCGVSPWSSNLIQEIDLVRYVIIFLNSSPA